MKTQRLCLATIGVALLAATAQAQPKSATALPINPLATPAQQRQYSMQVLLAQITADNARLAKVAAHYSPHSEQYRLAQAQLEIELARYAALIAPTQNKPDNLYPGWRLTMLSRRCSQDQNQTLL